MKATCWFDFTYFKYFICLTLANNCNTYTYRQDVTALEIARSNVKGIGNGTIANKRIYHSHFIVSVCILHIVYIYTNRCNRLTNENVRLDDDPLYDTKLFRPAMTYRET